jgi:PAS domain S-box-containing protein
MEFTQYTVAKAKYLNTLRIKKMPLISWNFHAENLEIVKKTTSDCFLLNTIAKDNNWQQQWDLKQELQNQTVIVVTCPKLKIVFASQNIMKMNGYKPNEVIGNSPKMFQGPETDQLISKQISQSVNSQKPFDTVVVNYRKDGSLYKCRIKGFPIFNNKGLLTNFIAFEKAA